MTATVLSGVPIPKRSGGPASEGLYASLRGLLVDQTLFVPGGTSRSTSATVARVAKSTGYKYVSRKIAMTESTKTKSALVVDSGTPGATEGLGVWRVS